MPADAGKTPIPGSDRQSLPNAQLVGPVDPDEHVEITIVVRPSSTGSVTLSAEALGNLLPGERTHLSRQDLAAGTGADPADLAKVQEFARAHNLDVLEVSAPRRSVRLGGTVAAFSEAFGVQLNRYEVDGKSYRGRVGPVLVPTDLAPIIQAVMGLDDRPQASAHLRIGLVDPHAATATYSPVQVGQLYDFPRSGNGQGQCVAIIELGGGYRDAELVTYFKQLGLNPPTVVAVSVDGAANNPGVDTNADTEVLLDIEVVGAIAPGANLVVYFAPNTDNGFLDAITTAVHDVSNNPSVVSISWGGPESSWTTQAMQTFNQAFQDAATLGLTICCASGDSGSTDGVADGLQHVDFPASSPFALACGGTSLQSVSNAITQETVWNDASGATGGGVSDFFPLPNWQSGAGIPPSANPNKKVGRGVPDVAGNADPATGYRILADGNQLIVGGTSAVAPLWAGLVALINQQLGQSIGYFNPLLYNRLAGTVALQDIVTGSNGAYLAASGWDPCTGFGSPVGTKLLQALSPQPVPTNPPPTNGGVSPSGGTTQTGSLDFVSKVLQWLASLLRSLFPGDQTK